MQPGLSSYTFGWSVSIGRPPMDHFALLDVARRQGVRVVQFADNLPVHQLTPRKRQELRAAASECGVRLELGARGLTESSLKSYVALCGELGCDFLRFVVDEAGYEPAPDELVRLLRSAAPALESAEVTLGLENHDRFRAAELRRLIEEVASPRVGICLDTANSLGAGEGLEHVAALLAPVAVNVHVKDVTIRRLPHLQGFTIEGCPLGEGCLPIRALLDQLRRRGYGGSVILESWRSPGTDAAATVSGELATAEFGLATLRQWLAAEPQASQIAPAGVTSSP